jgi:integrase
MAITKREGKRGVAYRVTVDFPPDPVTGKRRRGTETFRTRKEAESREREWLSQIEKGTVVTTTKTTLAAHLRAWLDLIATTVRPTTLQGYRASVERHLIPRIGAIPVAKITSAQIQAAYSVMLADGIGVRGVQLAHLRLLQSLALAVAWGMRVDNPALKVTPPRAPRKEMRVWTKEQVRAFLAAAADDADADSEYALFLLALTTGMRRGELLGVRWQDVDLARGTLRVAQAVALLHDRPTITQPKTAAARRTLPLPAPAVDAIRAHRDRARIAAGGAWRDDVLVFSATGAPMHPRTLAYHFARIVKAAGVPKIRVHDMRHTYATLSLSGGADLKTISTRLGHTSIQVTGDVYAHVTVAMDERATEVISAVIFG